MKREGESEIRFKNKATSKRTKKRKGEAWR